MHAREFTHMWEGHSCVENVQGTIHMCSSCVEVTFMCAKNMQEAIDMWKKLTCEWDIHV